VRTLAHPIERKVIAPLIVNEILYRLLSSDSAAAIRGAVARAPDAPRILSSMRFIEEHLAEKLTVEQLAKRAGMSASHYAHRWGARASRSPKTQDDDRPERVIAIAALTGDGAA